MFFNFFRKPQKKRLPDFIESVDDFAHLKLVKLRGDLDAKAMGQIQGFLRKAKARKLFLNKNMILDLRKVSSVDTAAIAQLLSIVNELKHRNQHLGIMNVPEKLKNMITIHKLEQVVTSFDSKKMAFSEILAWSQDWN